MVVRAVSVCPAPLRPVFYAGIISACQLMPVRNHAEAGLGLIPRRLERAFLATPLLASMPSLRPSPIRSRRVLKPSASRSAIGS